MRLTVFFCVFFAATLFTPAFSQNNAFLSFSVGTLGIDDHNKAVDYRLEYRASKSIKGFSPTLGLQATSQASLYSFMGFSRDVRMSNEFYLVPSLGVGAYRQGDGKNLGGVLEFRSGLEFALNLGMNARASVAVHHLSNSSIYQRNPGIESIVFSYCFVRPK
ncbi:MAG: acyloxyacyl hydrolase [Deferribacteres bacterium]|nr:acyloxyacyl hydrolase [candidate division KSB1 bacterium]MCB9500410.1 acyloxyacyl hydrolase [Deferribacteres bacterium]